MIELNNTELLSIVGGINWTGVLVNAIRGAGEFVYSVGQAFGSSLRRISGRTLCPIK